MGSSPERRISQLEAKYGELYLPDPETAEDHRQRMPFEQRPFDVVLFHDPAVAVANFRGNQIYASTALDARGFTYANAFYGIDVIRDSIAADLGESLLFTCLLQGAVGSVWNDLAVVQLQSTGRTGIFDGPVLGAISLSLQVRFVLCAADNTIYEVEPLVPRELTLSVSGMLVAGYQM